MRGVWSVGKRAMAVGSVDTHLKMATEKGMVE
jgi:hypothetical protein